MCDRAGRWLLPLLLPGQSKIFLSTLSSHLVAPSRRLVRLGGFPWLLQAEVPKKKPKQPVQNGGPWGSPRHCLDKMVALGGVTRATYQPCHTPPRATILYRYCLGEPQGPPFCNRTKHLEDATKWPHKVDRKILDWPGSSKATQAIPRLEAARATYQPWDGLCSFAAARPVQDLPV